MRLIDDDALIEAHYQHCNEHHGDTDIFYGWSLELMRNAQTIDAVPVVRCKDCVYRVIMRDPLRKPMDCYGCKVMHYNEDDWFCSFGERKDDE